MLTAEMDAPVANGHAADIGPVPYPVGDPPAMAKAKAKAKAKPRAGKVERRSATVDNDETGDCAFPPRVGPYMLEESAVCIM